MFRKLTPILLLAMSVAACSAAGVDSEVAPEDVIFARDTALDHLFDHYRTGPAPSLVWYESEVPSDSIGWVEYQYSAERWIVTVAGPVGNRYEVIVTNPAESFWWAGGVSPGGRVAEGSMDVLAACDATTALVAGEFPDLRVDVLEWSGCRVTPTDLVGQETYRFTSDDWILTVSYPVVAPSSVMRHVALENSGTGFVWEGDLDAGGQFTQTAAYSLSPWVSGRTEGGA